MRVFAMGELEELDKKIVESNRNEKGKIDFCPNCGSTNVKPVIYGFSKDSAAISPQMKCVDCKFYGFMLRATPEEIVEYRKKMKQ